MNKSSFVLMLCLINIAVLRAQQELDFGNGCNFASDKTAGTYTLFGPSEEAIKIVDEILDTWDSNRLKTLRFTLQLGNVENAQATERNGVRYLLLSHKFMEDLKKDAQAKWAAYFVLAHEIGHQVYEHDFSQKDVVERRRMELQADRFASIILARMSAARSDAMAAIQSLKAQLDGSSKPAYYPDVSAREEVVSIAYDKEWNEVKKKSNASIGAERIFINLNPDSYNKSNLVSKNSVSAYVTDEKVVVQYKIPSQHIGKKVIVTLDSDDFDVPMTVRGTGVTIVSAGEKTVEWNYQMDFVSKAIASQPNKLHIHVEEIEDFPYFPFPPPAASAEANLDSFFVACKILKDADRKLRIAFDAAGYNTKRYFHIPGGFALVSQMEQFNEDGSCKSEKSRWSKQVVRCEDFSLECYLNSLLTSKPGYFRVFAVMVTSHILKNNLRVLTREEATDWMKKGANKLPDDICKLTFDNNTNVTTLIYEFKVRESDRLPVISTPSELNGLTHLKKSKIINFLK